MKMKWGIIAGVLGGIAAAEAGGSAYFYRRTMMRYNAKKERTMKMSGVDGESYYIFMKVFQHLAQGVIAERPIFCNNSSRNEVNIDDAAIV